MMSIQNFLFNPSIKVEKDENFSETKNNFKI